MTAHFDQPRTCPLLVGRVAYTDGLVQRLTATQHGHGQVLLLCGEAGIGKSRLVVEGQRVAAANGFSLLHGTCFEMDRMLSYAPLYDLLHTVRTAPAAADVHPLATELAALLDLDRPPPDNSIAQPGSEHTRRRLFQVLTHCLLSLGMPMLFVVKDLHWSDDNTLHFLLFFLRHIAPQPILLLLTLRDDAHVHPALYDFLAELRSSRVLTDGRWIACRVPILSTCCTRCSGTHSRSARRSSTLCMNGRTGTHCLLKK